MSGASEISSSADSRPSQVNKPHTSGVLTSYIKGAPERVLAKCSTYLKDGKLEPITDEFSASYDEAYNVSFRLRPL